MTATGTTRREDHHPMLTINVVGTPAPQGSHRGFVVNGRAVITQDNKKTKPWRQDVKHTALEARTTYAWETIAGPVAITIAFTLPRPRYHYGTGRNAHTIKATAPSYVEKKPDIDKLTRATLDALTEAGIWRDDSQVAAMTVTKRYADHQPPGAHITVAPLDPVVAPPPLVTADATTAITPERQGFLL